MAATDFSTQSEQQQQKASDVHKCGSMSAVNENLKQLPGYRSRLTGNLLSQTWRASLLSESSNSPDFFLPDQPGTRSAKHHDA